MLNISILTDACKQITDDVISIEFILRTAKGQEELAKEKLAYMYSYPHYPCEKGPDQTKAKLQDILTDVARLYEETVIPESVLGYFMLEDDKFYQQEKHFPRLCRKDTLYLIAGLGEQVKRLIPEKVRISSLGQIKIVDQKQLDDLLRLTKGIYKGYKKGVSPSEHTFPGITGTDSY